MKPFVAALALCPLLALSAWSQSPSPQPLTLQQFLDLSNDQAGAIVKNNEEYNTFSFQQQRQIRNAQSQIVVEIAKDHVDPMAVGTLYAGIESACRDLREKAAATQKQNLSILTAAQKARLNVLNDAMKLIPTISQAQLENLLESTVSPPNSFSNDWFMGAYTNGFALGGVSGCGGSILGNPFFGVAGMNTPAPANLTVNQWFDRTDLYRGGFETLTKPQTRTR